MSSTRWTAEERKALRQLYPKATIREITQAVNKSWYACQKEAQALRLKRKKRNSTTQNPKPPRYSVGKRQLAELLQEDLTVAEIAEMLKTTPDIVRRSIFKYGL